MAETTSDLNTDTEAGNKRHRKKKIISSSSESDENDEPTEHASNRKQFKVTKMPTPPIWTNDMAEMVDELTVSNTPSQTGNSSTPCFTPGQVHHDRNMGPGSKSNYTTPKRALKEIHENLNNVVVTSQSTSCCCNPQLLYNIQSLLIEINSKSKIVVSEICKLMKSLQIIYCKNLQ
ncbi:uncharacterized protein LOC126892019 isoform X1 [Diabrotica virgifera virgifera]|uniref:Uncharacterized protein n=1 Tax=Diabrotica virgifera virgifera TaxID=50390 RepID=A0ABM5L4N8_DIAVI|nr:uncharacterized protein LOC126892019 isoform X1 [Diabrotica virgifera virgifera]